MTGRRSVLGTEEISYLDEVVRSVRSPRVVELDRLRGLAVALMILDHVWYLAAGPLWLRLTVTRVAMPLFFILAGHLARRIGPRHALIAGVGMALPVAVPWIDDPNVLTWYVLGAVVVVAARRWPVVLGLVVVAALTMLANGFRVDVGTGYDPVALVALMGAGSLMPRWWLVRAGSFLPSWLAAAGRYPLSVYVGHLLILQGLVMTL